MKEKIVDGWAETKKDAAGEHAAPLLSVIMPVHNPGKYLRPCLDSVLGQTFRDFELIAIDDTSTDHSMDVLKSYAANDSRLRPLSNETNLGAAKTRNRGLELARGKYVLFLDADDFFDTGYFADAIETLERTKATLVISPILVHDETTGEDEPAGVLSPEMQERVGEVFSAETFPESLFESFIVAPFNKVIRREFLLTENVRFQTLPSCNDVYFGLMVLALAPRIAYLPHAYVHYRANWPGQISAKRGKHPQTILAACEKLGKDLKAHHRWELCRQSYHGYAVQNIIGHIQLAEHPKAFLQQVREEGLPRLGMDALKRQDFCSGWRYERAYVQYRMFYTGEAILGHRPDILRCGIGLLLAAQWVPAVWLVGHYVKRFIWKLMGKT